MTDTANDDIIEEFGANPGVDVEMAERTGVATDAGNGDRSELPFAGEDTVVELESTRTPFIDYLTSPVVTLIVGSELNETTLTAHQSLLIQSPYFQVQCDNFSDDGSPRQLELPEEDMDAVGCFLEYLYTGEYFPKKLPGQRTLESDASIPEVDETGEQLLKHARVYTLAEKFQVPSLRTLASSKIHCVNSTAKGEIAYAQYVYAYTPDADTAIRAPIANFWASRSHTLRAEAEPEFKALCLQFPQFGYDVLTRVLDEKLKRETNAKMHPGTPGSARKRPRHSNT
ncbi:hypothetical protein M406DRAFT_245725 [Cryphonectria parasitica EP155]|uniref:BTB domain-containing protein n=1 Tax=Cryphonectria parasitica (strain ATCC 38755 / EP155) TaxID=660469 RepID=A0A9P4Y9K1_CRYP1|nr:uncharacterized protein M406DRAFT_245725 [Cryphonectria parasitica EP155]KAF3769462.1 hypothetical protein M406DRAFT_245725 [Cryphonectria parasitica EP155]